MSLDEQISQINNPQEFTRLCNFVFSAAFPGDFQAIDGTRGDAGNDGYIRSEARVLAFHCPVKPDQKTDKAYKEKILKDLGKATQIRDSGDLPVRAWTFVTPRKLAHDLIVFIQSESQKRGLSGSHLEATYLATMLLEHPNLIKEFPGLHVSELEDLLRKALVVEERIEQRIEQQPESSTSGAKRDVLKGAADATTNERVLEIRAAANSPEGKAELRAILYRSADPVVQLNALLGVLDAFDPMEDRVPDLVGLCETGIALAKRIGSTGTEAFLLAKKGNFISFLHSRLDIEEWASNQADMAIGMVFEPERRPKNLAKLQEYKKKYAEAFTKALELAQSNSDAGAFAAVMVELGNAAGLRAGNMRVIGLDDAAGAELAICKDALLRAKNVYAAIGDSLGALRATFNIANQIRFQGEIDEAKHIVTYVLGEARKLGDADLIQKATWMKETLETGHIPDYVNGERRKRTQSE